MGLYIHLIANFNGITAEQWEQTYAESLKLLEQFPAPLMRLTREEIRAKTRYVFTAEVRENIDTPAERWNIVGDMISGRCAENFYLYRNIEHYTVDGYGIFEDDVLLFERTRTLAVGRSGAGINIFGDKTQGYPYHLAILAVGVLIESRFPENIYVSGDFDKASVEQLIPWINTVVEKPVSMPICLDGKRLFGRLDKLYDDEMLACEEFTALFGGSYEDALKELLLYGDKSLVLKQYVHELGRYQSLDQSRAVRMLKSLLEATQDLPELIELVQEAKNDKLKRNEDVDGFQLTTLLRVLSRHYITFETKEREPLHAMVPTAGRLANINELFSRTLLTLQGPPGDVQFYLPASQLLALFSGYAPEHRELFETTIQESEARCRQDLNTIRQVIDERMAASADPEPDGAATPHESSTITEEISTGDTLRGEEFLTRQIHAQMPVFQDAEEIARTTGNALQRLDNKLSEEGRNVKTSSREECLSLIYCYSFQAGIVLAESTWAEIDAEQSLDTLNVLLLLTMVKEYARDFCALRVYLLEHKHLWPLMARK